MDTSYCKSVLKQLLERGLGLNTNCPQLKDTPERMAKMYAEVFSSVGKEFNEVTVFPNENGRQDIIISDCIPFASTCEHHFVPFMGHCWVLYIPNTEFIVGFSKFARIVDFFSKRPQTQERLVNDIADFIMDKASPKGVMVYARAKHSCAMCRGVKSGPTNGLSISTTRGVFHEAKELELRGIELIKLSLLSEQVL